MNLITTVRLKLDSMSVEDCDFIIELVNTEGWKSFIGNRNIETRKEAKSYIGKYISDKNTNIWLINLKKTNIPIGIITILKRDYLEYHDIGFALLPEYFHKGFGFEAANAVLKYLKEKNKHSHIQATTVPENVSSVKLLERLGFKFENEIIVEKKILNVYILQLKF